MKNKTKKNLMALLGIIIIAICGFFNIEDEISIGNYIENTTESNNISYKISNIPEYTGEIYVTINNNIPEFTTEDFNLEEDYYSELVNGKVRNGYDKNQLEKSK